MRKSSTILASSSILILLVISPLVAFAATGAGGFASSPAAPPIHPNVPSVLLEPNVFYGNEYGSCPAHIDAYDPASDTHVTYALTTPANGMCNGRGMAWDGTNLWYTVVAFGSTQCSTFQGDGLIHEVGLTGGADIATMPDPYGNCGRGIGAMKFDAPGGHLWVESYIPVNNMVEVSELSVPTGTVLASCEVPFQGGGEGSDTFSLFTNNEFATDGGEILTTLFFYHMPGLGSFGGACVQAGSPSTIQGATGLNFASNGDCIYTNGGGTTFNGSTDCNTVLAQTNNAFPNEEDITCVTVTQPASICTLPPPINSVPEFGLPALAVSAIALLGLAVFRVAKRQSIPALGI